MASFQQLKMSLFLFRIETESQPLSGATRKTIYTHLSAFLPVKLAALTKRAKKLRTNEQDDKLKEPINRLREGRRRLILYRKCFPFIEQSEDLCVHLRFW